MFAKASLPVVVLALLAARPTFAAVPLFGQCGGVGYTGDTQCVAGGTCVKLNDFYSQCQASTAAPTTSVTTSAPTTSAPTTPTSTVTTPRPTSTQTGPIIVLPLGDSITWGMGSNDGNAYRKELKDLLTKDGVTIDYIGTQKNGNMQDNDNQGHSGATIAQISGYADTPLRQKPEVVTLMAGTNDMVGSGDTGAAANRLIALVDKILSASPSSTVLVASLVPLSFGQANVDSYNNRIRPLIEAKTAAGQHVVFVSMAALTNSDLSDGVHPSAGGYVKMGQAWYRGWQTAKEKGWIR